MSINQKKFFFMIKTFKLINNKNYKLKIVGTDIKYAIKNTQKTSLK